jgi:MFS family permease
MWLILIAVTLHFTRHGIIFPFIPLLADKMGAGPTTIGFIVGAFSLIAVFMSIPLGGLVDRFGVKRLLLFGVICNIANAVILLHTDTVSKLIIFAVSLRSSFLPLLLRAEGLTEFSVGILISVFAVMATSIRLVFGRLLDLFDRKTILVYSMLAIILAVALIPSMASVAGFTILISIFGLGFGMTQPLSMVMISDLTDPAQSGLAMGLRFTAIMLAGLISPILLGFIIERIGVSPAFYVAASVVALAGIRMFIIRPDLIPGRRL